MPFRVWPIPAKAVTAGILAAGLGFSLAANLPGHLSYDSVIQLLEGRQAAYGNWHPPIMSWLLGAFDALAPGTSLFVIWGAFLLYASAFSLLLLPGKVSWAAAATALFCVITPQFFLYPGIVWKDVLFAVLAVAAFICLTHVSEQWRNERLRFGLIAISCLLLAMAALARQNGAIIVPVAAIALGWIGARHSSARQGLIYGVAMFAVVACVALAARTALETRVYGDKGPFAQIQLLQTYDIIGALKADPDFSLARIESDDPDLARELRTDGVKLYTPERNDTLTKSSSLQATMNNADPDVISAQWYDLVLHHTWLYLKIRWEIFGWVFLTPNLSACVPYEVGVDGPPSVLSALGIAERMDSRDLALENYGKAFVRTPILSHLAAAFLAVAELIVLLRRKRDADIAIAAMLAGALIFTLTFFVISIACDYRYLYFLDVSALIALLYLMRDAKIASAAHWRSRHNT